MNSAGSFAIDYADARAKFLEAATQANAAVESVEHPSAGPTGGRLFTDVAWLGPKSAERVLVLVSGTHGAEGFCGSGAQIDWLRRGEGRELPGGVAVLLIHAINPYGFAWLRRVSEDNVDLNRNWLDFQAPLPSNDGYAELKAAVVPHEWTDESRRQSEAVLLDFARTRGPAALAHALSGGQYSDPTGIFYGGARPSWSRLTQTRIYADYLAEAGAVGMIDYHTGLGPRGFGTRMVSVGRETPAFQRAETWWGLSIVTSSDGSSLSGPRNGSGHAAAPALLPGVALTPMVLEVGTVSPKEVIMALRADAWLHAHGDLNSATGEEIKRQVRAAYYDDSDAWKGMVAGQSLVAVRQAIAGLGQKRRDSAPEQGK